MSPVIQYALQHSWDLTPEEGYQLQVKMHDLVISDDHLGAVQTIGGVDVGFEQGGKIARAAVVVVNFPELKPIETSLVCLPTPYPYIPGLLSFREMPSILKALEALVGLPDLLLCDGHGLAHPRRFGIASHLGVYCDIPTIGVAKHPLTGGHRAVADLRGAYTTLTDKGEVIGVALRTCAGTKPIYVSVGHKISLGSAMAFVLKCCPQYRIPDPIRYAHLLATKNRFFDRQ